MQKGTRPAPKRRIILDLFRELGRERVQNTPIRALRAMLRERVGEDNLPHLSTLGDTRADYLYEGHQQEIDEKEERERFSWVGHVLTNAWRLRPEQRGKALAIASKLQAMADPKAKASAPLRGKYSFKREISTIKPEHQGEALMLLAELDAMRSGGRHRGPPNPEIAQQAVHDALNQLLLDPDLGPHAA